MGTLPPVVGTMLADFVGVKRLTESIAASVAAAAAPVTDAVAKMAAQQSAAISFGKVFSPDADMHAKLADQVGAKAIASYAASMTVPRDFVAQPPATTYPMVRRHTPRSLIVSTTRLTAAPLSPSARSLPPLRPDHS